MRALVLVVVAACSSKDGPPTEGEMANPCDRELSMIGGALDAALAAPPDMVGEAFEATVGNFTKATMCGPDIAEVLRAWVTHFNSRGGEVERRELLVRFDHEAKKAASVRWRMPAKLAKQIEHAHSAK